MGQGLHGIIDDLYSDLSLNPAYIKRFKGNWLFTNFSNLQGGADARIFDQNLTLLQNMDLYPNNLVGTISDRFGFPFGIILETRGSDISTEEQTDDALFLTLSSGTSTRIRQVIAADNASKSLSFIGFFRDFGIALSIHRNDFNLQLENENATGAFTINDTTGLRENTAFVKDETVRKFAFPNSMIGFSIGKIIRRDNEEISIAIGRRPEHMGFHTNEILSLFKEPFLNGIAEKFTILENQDIGFFEMGLRSLYLNARLKKIYPSLTDLRQYSYFFNYTRYSLPFNIETAQKTVRDSLDVAGAMRKNISRTLNGFSTAGGDGTINRIELGAGIERHFNNLNTLIAFGAKLDYIWGGLDVSFKPGRIVENLDIKVEIGDPAEEAGSYTRVISDNKEGNAKTEIRGTFLSFPAGLETKLTDKFTLRLGVRTVIPVTFKTELESRDSDRPDELLETDEDQTTFVPENGPGGETTVKREIDGKNLNFTSYHFGASYEINDAVTIDLLHFSKITELDTWWLSLVLKY